MPGVVREASGCRAPDLEGLALAGAEQSARSRLSTSSAGRLRVVASLVRLVGQEPRLEEPKSHRSRRLVELSTGAFEALRRRRQANPSIGFVFARVDGSPLSVTTTWKRWRRLLAAAKVRPVRFHDARHTAATLLLSRGVHPKVVSEMLGHSTVAITLDVYSHVTPAMHREAARVMDEILT